LREIEYTTQVAQSVTITHSVGRHFLLTAVETVQWCREYWLVKESTESVKSAMAVQKIKVANPIVEMDGE